MHKGKDKGKDKERDYLTRGELEAQKKRLVSQLEHTPQDAPPPRGWRRFVLVWHSVTCGCVLIFILLAVLIGLYLSCAAGYIC
jgi:hypothetical protein